VWTADPSADGRRSATIFGSKCNWRGHIISSYLDDKKGKGSPYSITERRVPELIHVLGSQPAGDWSPLPLLSAMPAVTLATLIRELLPISLLGERRHDGCEQGVYTLQPLVQPDLQPVA